MPHTIIALSGWKQSGKDSVSDIIWRNTPVVTMSFATPLKGIIRDIFCVQDNIISNKEEKLPITTTIFDKPKSYRELCIYFGETLKQLTGRQDIFAIAIRNNIEEYVKNSKNDRLFVISDVRYRSEMEMLDYFRNKGYNVQHYCVLRKKAVPNWARNGVKPWKDKIYAKSHNLDRSEYEWCSMNPVFTDYIYNDGTFADLEKEVKEKIIARIK